MSLYIVYKLLLTSWRNGNFTENKKAGTEQDTGQVFFIQHTWYPQFFSALLSACLLLGAGYFPTSGATIKRETWDSFFFHY